MITGELSEYNEIVLPLTVCNEHGEESTVDAILDTGFSSYPVIPQNIVWQADVFRGFQSMKLQ